MGLSIGRKECGMKATKVRWFHPDGEKMPNGVFFQRGGWLAECAENAKHFVAADGVGVVVFPSGAQVEGGGKAFSGSYVSEDGIRYDSGSPTRALEGVSGRELLKCAAEMAEAWGQPEVLVREADGKDIWVVSMPATQEKPAPAPKQEWTVRDLTREPGAYNGVRWWAEWALDVLGGIAPSGAVLFPERRGVNEKLRRRVLLDVAVGVAPLFGAKPKDCQVVRIEDLPTAYRGVGAMSPVLLAEGIAPEKWADFAKAVCAAAKEEKAVVYPGGDGALWWLERCRGEEECDNPKVGEREEKDMEMADGSESVVRESLRCEEWFRTAGRVVVARVRVEEWKAADGVFRSAWLKAKKERGCAGMMFVLRWERKGAGAGEAGEIVERAWAVSGLAVEEVRELVASVPGAVCREVQVGTEVNGDGKWQEEVFGERPEGAAEGEWVLAEAGYVEPPRPSVFGWHDRYLPIRARGKAGGREESSGVAAPMAPKVHAVSLLQWMGPRSWADQTEEQRVPERFEKVLREGHHAWFRVAAGEGVPTSRCWMVFNEPGQWNYWRRYGVTRVLDVCPEGCRGYWSADGKQWWQVGACAPRGKRVHVRNAKAAYRAACGEMPWEVPFFDGSEKNRERLERMYAHMAGVLDRAGLEDATVSRRMETAATSRSGFSRWANRGMLYGGRFGWEKGEVW